MGPAGPSAVRLKEDGSSAAPPRVTLGALFLAFAKVSLVSVGGGTQAWIRQVTVKDRQWLDDDEFAQALAVCQFLPGPNTLNMATFLGARFRGAPGAGACLAGLTLLPFLIVLGLGMLYFRTGYVPRLAGAFTGLGAAAAGVAFGTALNMGMKRKSDPRFLTLTLFVFTTLAFARWSVLAVVPLVLLAAALLYRGKK